MGVDVSNSRLAAHEPVNILLVDDQPAKLLAHKAILDELGENIISVNSGVKALEILLKFECAVIVLDVNMPGMDGFETASMIRGRPSLERTPIIFVSGYNVSDLDRMKGYGIGAVDYLYIPIVPEILRAKVQAFVEVFRQRQMVSKIASRLAEQNREKESQLAMIKELNVKLKSAYEELEAFSYSVSHDLRGPLRAMRGYSELLISDFGQQLPPEGLLYLKRIGKAAVRMDTLIRDILAYSRATKEELSLVPVDLENLLLSILETAESLRPPYAQIRMQKPFHRIIAHEACLTQCLSNLLQNAVKFVPKGTVPEVRIRTELREAQVRIWIEDNGIGIGTSQRTRIFQMFGRVHGDSSYEGNGIGLAIVRMGAERMGGRVGLESEPGKGSQFWIELPAATDQPSERLRTPGSEPLLITEGPAEAGSRPAKMA